MRRSESDCRCCLSSSRPSILRTGEPHFKSLAKRWAKVTGLLFAVGAVSGTALSLELGLLWPKYMEAAWRRCRAICSAWRAMPSFSKPSLLACTLYGWDRLSPVAHWWCGVVIAVSGMLSGILVLGVNAWMQQPVGFQMEGGRVIATDPLAILRQPLWFYMACIRRWRATWQSLLRLPAGTPGDRCAAIGSVHTRSSLDSR